MTVFTVNEGECDSAFVGIWSSREGAVSGIKARYPAPYSVRWGELKQERSGMWSLPADFAAVPGFSTARVTMYDIAEVVVLP